MSNVDLKDELLFLFSENIKYLKNLNTLYLDKNLLEKKDSMQSLIESLIKLKHFAHLSLANNNVKNCLKEISYLINNSNTLKNIDLSGNQIENVDALIIKKCNLAHLNLSNNLMADKGIMQFLNWLKNNSLINHVYLSNNNSRIFFK